MHSSRIILCFALANVLPVLLPYFMNIPILEEAGLDTLSAMTPGMIGSFFFILLVSIIIAMFLAMILVFATKQYMDQKPVVLGDIFQHSLNRFFPYIGTALMQGIFVFFLMLLLIVPGVIFGVYWTFAATVVLLQNKSGLDALRHSKALVHGRWWSVVGYILSFALCGFLIGFVIGFVLGFGSVFMPQMVFDVLDSLVSTFLNAFFIIAWVVLYLNFEATKPAENTQE